MNAPRLRLATLDEVAAIDALMKASIRDLFPNFYDAKQTESSVKYIAVVDRMLIEDGTYFVAEADGELVACGGWSRRDKLYTGFWCRQWRRSAPRSSDRTRTRAGHVRPFGLDSSRPGTANPRGL